MFTQFDIFRRLWYNIQLVEGIIMEINKKNEMQIIRLHENTFWNVDGNTEENLKIFKELLRDYIIKLKKIVESDFDKLFDQELYTILNDVYDIQLDQNDYLFMLSKYNGKRYVDFNLLPTTMFFKSVKSEGHGKSLDMWEQLYQVCYLVAISDTFECDYNKIYSKEEIKELVDNKTIILLKRKDKEADYYGSFAQGDYEQIPTLGIDVSDYTDNLNQFVLDNFNLFGELLRKKFTKARVLKDIKEIIEEFDCDINDVFDEIDSDDLDYSDIARVCKEWYDSSEEKEDYQGIQKKLSR